MRGEDLLVEIEDLRVQRGTFELAIDRLEIGRGRVIGLVGPNGAGKTTLLRQLVGLDDPGRGQLRVAGRDPRTDVEAVRHRVGFAADDVPLFDLRVDRLLRFVSGYYPSWDPHRVDALVERFGVDLGKRPRDLSKGEGAKLRLLLALAHRPELVLLDEPAAGLDLGGRRKLLQTVIETVSEPQVTVVISSHQLFDVERVADELVVLDQGRIQRAGTVVELVGDDRSLEEAMDAWGLAS